MGVSGMPEEPKRQDKDAQVSENFLQEMERAAKEAQESEEKENTWNNRWDKIKGIFLDHPTLALTFLYLYLTAIGMLYSAVLYRSFGINIFDYSEIADFLFAALKNPIALLLTGSQVAAVLITIV